MAMSGKTLKAILLAGTIVFGGIMLFAAPPHLAQATDGGPSVAKTSNVNSDHEPETGTIDEAGQKVGEKIEQFETKASNQLGDWIGGKVYADISWIKLLFSMLLIVIVVTIERAARFLIQRRINSLQPIEGKISWSRLLLRAMAYPISLVIWIYGIYGALSPLFPHFQSADGNNLVYLIFQKALELGGITALFLFIYQFINVVDVRLSQWAKATESTIDDILVPLVGKTLRVFVVILAGVIIIQNLTSVEIGPLLASLGIGGLAVALAAKDSIANFFGTLTILFDKPFQVGERIIIDNYDGEVEHVGFRSTRIRLLTGHLVTIPNEKVVNSGLENIGKRPHVRWSTNIGITYNTPPEKIEKAVEIIREILADHEGIHPDFPPRVYFNGFNDWSLNIMILVRYHPPNYWDLQAWIERTCLEITRRFSAESIEFAFPTRTLHLHTEAKRSLKVDLPDKGNQET